MQQRRRLDQFLRLPGHALPTGEFNAGDECSFSAHEG